MPIYLGRTNSLVSAVLRAIRRFLGVDIASAIAVHKAVANQRIDALYGHSEIEYLGAALGLFLTSDKTRAKPVLVGQTIWQFSDRGMRSRLLYWMERPLFNAVDLFVYNSRANLRLGHRLMPEKEHVFVPFGVSSVFQTDHAMTDRTRSFILSVGNDRARDWKTLLQAIAYLPDSVVSSVRIAATPCDTNDARVEFRRTDELEELLDLYRNASLTVICTKKNAYASGITTLMEAAGAGSPIVATYGGGLEDYFCDGKEALLVEPENPTALSDGIRQLLQHPDFATRIGEGAWRRSREDDWTNKGYWCRIVDVINGAVDRRN